MLAPAAVGGIAGNGLLVLQDPAHEIKCADGGSSGDNHTKRCAHHIHKFEYSAHYFSPCVLLVLKHLVAIVRRSTMDGLLFEDIPPVAWSDWKQPPKQA